MKPGGMFLFCFNGELGEFPSVVSIETRGREAGLLDCRASLAMTRSDAELGSGRPRPEGTTLY